MDSFCQLWAHVSLISSTTELLHQVRIDVSIASPSSAAGTPDSGEACVFVPALPASKPSGNNSFCDVPVSFLTAEVPSDVEAMEEGSCHPSRSNGNNDLHHDGFMSPNNTHAASEPPSIKNSRYDSSVTWQSSSHAARHPNDAAVQLIVIHYLWDSRRSLEHILDVVQSIAEGYPSNEPICVLLRKLKEASNRLFVLLPLERLSDYIVQSETSSAKLEDAANVAATLLGLVEDLYLLCADEKGLEGENDHVVSLDRLHKLNGVFAEPSEEDRGHINFLEACLSNPTVALSASNSFLSLEDAFRAVLRIKPIKSKLQHLGTQDSTVDDASSNASSVRFSNFSQMDSPLHFIRLIDKKRRSTQPPPKLVNQAIQQSIAPSEYQIVLPSRSSTPLKQCDVSITVSSDVRRSGSQTPRSGILRDTFTKKRLSFDNSPAVRSSAMEIRGDQVDWVTLSSLKPRMERGCRVGDVHLGLHLPTKFMCNDNLIIHVIQDVLQYNKDCGLPASELFMHRCGMHLVIDIVPQYAVPHDTAANATYCSAIRDFYEKHETSMLASYLYPDKHLFSEGPSITTTEWIESLLQHGFVGVRDVTAVRGNRLQKRLSCSASFESVSSPTLTITPPSVWAVRSTTQIDGDQSIVPPTQYLSPRICELLLAIKAAVVVSSSGAATLAFPYITQDRVDLLKELNVVHQPVVDAAELGIDALNRMAEREGLKQQTRLWEQERHGEVIQLGYGPVTSTLVDELQQRSTQMPLRPIISPVKYRASRRVSDQRVSIIVEDCNVPRSPVPPS